MLTLERLRYLVEKFFRDCGKFCDSEEPLSKGINRLKCFLGVYVVFSGLGPPHRPKRPGAPVLDVYLSIYLSIRFKIKRIRIKMKRTGIKQAYTN